jgi:multiple sugar transport system ATP-binding protein
VADIKLHDITKRYADGTEAVKHMNLEIKDGEFMILVGPSGCGKSTALRMIAGLEDISEGELLIGDRVVNNLAPRDRDIAMVFQNYALYPHMTVRANMGFALKLAKVPQAEIDAKVEEAARILDLTEHLDRKPANLSGGQRQRVAMGRAIVRDPQAFLMDEPLSNLDAKLRVQTRTEVSRLQRRLETTMVYVTHDQTEAMTLGDRVAVMRSGVLQQVDAPRVLYNDPVNIFVAGFIGSPAMNFFSGTMSNGKVKLPFAEVAAPEGVSHAGEVIVGIRPEDFEDARFAPSDHSAGMEFTAPIEVVESMGSEIYVYFAFEGGEVSSAELAELARDSGVAETPSGGAGLAVARLNPESDVSQGERAKLWFDGAKLHLFDPHDGSSLRRAEREQAAAAQAAQDALEAESESAAPADDAAEEDAVSAESESAAPADDAAEEDAVPAESETAAPTDDAAEEGDEKTPD